jgi:hypothetical protein
MQVGERFGLELEKETVPCGESILVPRCKFESILNNGRVGQAPGPMWYIKLDFQERWNRSRGVEIIRGWRIVLISRALRQIDLNTSY